MTDTKKNALLLPHSVLDTCLHLNLFFSGFLLTVWLAIKSTIINWGKSVAILPCFNVVVCDTKDDLQMCSSFLPFYSLLTLCVSHIISLDLLLRAIVSGGLAGFESNRSRVCLAFSPRSWRSSCSQRPSSGYRPNKIRHQALILTRI